MDFATNLRPAATSALRKPSPTWVKELSIDQLSRLTDWVASGALTPSPFIYVKPPHLVDGVVCALLQKPDRYKSELFEVRIEAAEPLLQASCNDVPQAGTPCAHVRALLADLTACPEMGEALLAEKPTAPFLPQLSKARVRMRSVALITTGIRKWAPQSNEVEPLLIEASVEQSMEISESPHLPVICLRLRKGPGHRVLSRTELRAMPLSLDYLHLISLCPEEAGQKRHFRAAGATGALVLEHLREHPEWSVEGISFSQKTVRPHVVRARVTEKSAPFTLFSPWGARVAKQSRAMESQLIDGLEVRWRTEDGTLDVPATEAELFSGATSFVWSWKTRKIYPVDSRTDRRAAANLHRSPTLEVPGSTWEEAYQHLRTLGRSGIVLPSRKDLGLSASATTAVVPPKSPPEPATTTPESPPPSKKPPSTTKKKATKRTKTSRKAQNDTEYLSGEQLDRLADTIRAHLRNLPMRQRELALAAGTTQSKISRLICGRTPKIQTSTAAELLTCLRELNFLNSRPRAARTPCG